MTFLQPFILWALPLILVPVVIHLVNRMRHRPQPWAAMRFLVTATRSSTSHAKLRQFLILLLRVLAVLMIILFVARPLSGGWLGWAFSGTPDVVLLLLDRSASMEASVGTSTRREEALRLLSSAAQNFENSQLVLIESATGNAADVPRGAKLADLSLARGTETSADIPALLHKAWQWLIDNKAGSAEIWIASDLQTTNWNPEDPRWKSVVEQLKALPQRVKIRLLAMNIDPAKNSSIQLVEALRSQKKGENFLNLVMQVDRAEAARTLLPVTLSLNGIESQLNVEAEGSAIRHRHTVNLGAETNGGWGSLRLPPDGNQAGNIAYFAYGVPRSPKVLVATELPKVGRLLGLAAAAMAGSNRVEVVDATVALPSLKDYSLVLWQGALPLESAILTNFSREGGVVVCFPSGSSDPRKLNGLGWGEVKTTALEKPFPIKRWDQDQGPFSRTDEGFAIPLQDLAIAKRQQVLGQGFTLAAFEDGEPLLVRQAIGRGELYFCATLVSPDWSTLHEGPVLVPFLQRLMQQGTRRLDTASQLTSAELTAFDLAKSWNSLDTAGKNIQLQAGVYRAGDQTVAINIAAKEIESETLSAAQATGLFSGLTFQMLQEKRSRGEQLQSELWRFFLVLVLLFMLVEGFLILPAPKTQPAARMGAGA